MARKLKPFLVETIRHSGTGIPADIVLDRENKVFHSQVGDLTIEAPTHEECRKLTWQALDKFRPFVWRKVIVASVGSADRYFGGRPRGEAKDDTLTANLDLVVYRCQIADAVREGKALQRAFAVEGGEDSRSRCETFYDKDDHLVLPYTEDLWTKMRAIAQGCLTLRLRLEALLDPKNAGKELGALEVGRLLPASTDKETDHG